jgi:hypothetical protein
MRAIAAPRTIMPMRARGWLLLALRAQTICFGI